jgi:hypothetical protein
MILIERVGEWFMEENQTSSFEANGWALDFYFHGAV